MLAKRERPSIVSICTQSRVPSPNIQNVDRFSQAHAENIVPFGVQPLYLAVATGRLPGKRRMLEGWVAGVGSVSLDGARGSECPF